MLTVRIGANGDRREGSEESELHVCETRRPEDGQDARLHLYPSKFVETSYGSRERGLPAWHAVSSEKPLGRLRGPFGDLRLRDRCVGHRSVVPHWTNRHLAVQTSVTMERTLPKLRRCIKRGNNSEAHNACLRLKSLMTSLARGSRSFY